MSMYFDPHPKGAPASASPNISDRIPAIVGMNIDAGDAQIELARWAYFARGAVPRVGDRVWFGSECMWTGQQTEPLDPGQHWCSSLHVEQCVVQPTVGGVVMQLERSSISLGHAVDIVDWFRQEQGFVVAEVEDPLRRLDGTPLEIPDPSAKVWSIGLHRKRLMAAWGKDRDQEKARVRTACEGYEPGDHVLIKKGAHGEPKGIVVYSFAPGRMVIDKVAVLLPSYRVALLSPELVEHHRNSRGLILSSNPRYPDGGPRPGRESAYPHLVGGSQWGRTLGRHTHLQILWQLGAHVMDGSPPEYNGYYANAPDEMEPFGAEGGATDRFVDSVVFVRPELPEARPPGDESDFSGLAYCGDYEWDCPVDISKAMGDDELAACNDYDLCTLYPMINQSAVPLAPSPATVHVAAQRCRRATKSEVLAWLKLVTQVGKVG